MKKPVSVILILIFLFDIGGYYTWFSLRQNILQKEIGKVIGNGPEEKDLSLIIAPVNDESGIAWIKPDKEFRYKGEMYDVVRIKIKNQNTYYYCIKDFKEKQLIANFNKKHNSKKEAGKKINIFDYQSVPQQFSTNQRIYSTDISSPSIIQLYQSKNPDIHSPPPKMI